MKCNTLIHVRLHMFATPVLLNCYKLRREKVLLLLVAILQLCYVQKRPLGVPSPVFVGISVIQSEETLAESDLTLNTELSFNQVFNSFCYSKKKGTP